MDSVRTLIVGAGVSGLATAASLKDQDYLLIERDGEIGGYCKTVKQNGFTWDYSGHFFHFKRPDIEAWLRARMGEQRVLNVVKKSFIRYPGAPGTESCPEGFVDFPFQKNIHQLPRGEFIECLHDLYFAASRDPGEECASASFKDMLCSRFGRGIAERFLLPYNEKLYACDLATLDRDAMGRFFPHANIAQVVRNMRSADNSSYNATFNYPEGGAIEYVKAIASEVPAGAISLGETIVSIDLRRRVATTTLRDIRYESLVSSAPFHSLAQMTRLPHDPSAFTWNKVLVFNLGFDRKGPRDRHWVYYPSRDLSFYRVGFYDNIFGSDRMSLYVELGFSRDEPIDAPRIEALRLRVLADLARDGVVSDHRLLSHHSVVMNPAYVHITRRSIAEHARLSRIMRAHGVHSIGRYGGWTYCSIEDNIVEARGLAEDLNAA